MTLRWVFHSFYAIQDCIHVPILKIYLLFGIWNNVGFLSGKSFMIFDLMIGLHLQ